MAQYIVENKDMLPFKDMSDEDKLKIVNAMTDSNYVVDVYTSHVINWEKLPMPLIGAHGRYRVRAKATPLNIPWEHIHPDWKFAAMDFIGCIHLYVNKPHKTSNGWYNSPADYSVGRNILNTDNINWELSLTKRP